MEINYEIDNGIFVIVKDEKEVIYSNEFYEAFNLFLNETKKVSTGIDIFVFNRNSKAPSPNSIETEDILLEELKDYNNHVSRILVGASVTYAGLASLYASRITEHSELIKKYFNDENQAIVYISAVFIDNLLNDIRSNLVSIVYYPRIDHIDFHPNFTKTTEDKTWKTYWKDFRGRITEVMKFLNDDEKAELEVMVSHALARQYRSVKEEMETAIANFDAFNTGIMSSEELTDSQKLMIEMEKNNNKN